MAVGDECTVRVVGRYQDQNIVNTLHYRIVGQNVGEQLVLKSLLNIWETNIKAAWLARHSDAYKLIGLKAFRKTGAAKTPAFNTVDTSGDVVGTELPSSVCRTITLYTNSAKHRRRGRIMLSGTDNAHIDANDGSVATAEITLLTTLGTTMLAPMAVAGDEFQLGLPSTATDGWEDITDAKGRETPSSVTSRRIRQFLIG